MVETTEVHPSIAFLLRLALEQGLDMFTEERIERGLERLESSWS